MGMIEWLEETLAALLLRLRRSRGRDSGIRVLLSIGADAGTRQAAGARLSA
jgi:hypothetical protein